MKEFTNFKFHMYTDILFGKGTEAKVGEMIRKHGGTKVMLVYGGGSIKKSGLYDTIVKSLRDSALDFIELGGVQPNPRRSLAEKGLKMAQEANVNFMLGVGGGSSIDTAKAIAMGLANDGEFWKFYRGVEPLKMAPVGTIHTLSAAGSETSRSSVLLDDIETHRKYGFMWDATRPVFAIMNPELTYSVSRFQTGAGAADIFAHTVNRYFMAPASFLGDQYCEGTLRTVVKYGPIAVNNPTDYEARAELMLAGSFSHNDLNSIGRFSTKKGCEHALETQLSGTYDTAHGAGLSVIMPSWLQYLVNHGESIHVERVAQFAVNVFGVAPNPSDPKAVANEGLNRFRTWLTSLGMPITLVDLGVPREDLPEAIAKCNCNANGIIEGFLDLDKGAVAEIFTTALG